MVSNSVFTIL